MSNDGYKDTRGHKEDVLESPPSMNNNNSLFSFFYIKHCLKDISNILNNMRMSNSVSQDRLSPLGVTVLPNVLNKVNDKTTTNVIVSTNT